jgi:hypothetical protein
MSEDPTRGHGFDELARSLAEGSISRRRALKLFAGTAIAALIPSRAMAVTCPPGTVKVCDVPRRTDGTCRRGAAVTKCVTPGSAEANAIASNPCSCCGGCGGTDQCREPKPRTCFSTTSTTTTGTPSTTTTGTPSTTTTGTPSTTTTRACIPDGDLCVTGDTCCSTDQPRVCRGGREHPDILRCRPRL